MGDYFTKDRYEKASQDEKEKKWRETLLDEQKQTNIYLGTIIEQLGDIHDAMIRNNREASNTRLTEYRNKQIEE
jgi:hypothetical protein